MCRAWHSCGPRAVAQPFRRFGATVGEGRLGATRWQIAAFDQFVVGTDGLIEAESVVFMAPMLPGAKWRSMYEISARRVRVLDGEEGRGLIPRVDSRSAQESPPARPMAQTRSPSRRRPQHPRAFATVLPVVITSSTRATRGPRNGRPSANAPSGLVWRPRRRAGFAGHVRTRRNPVATSGIRKCGRGAGQFQGLIEARSRRRSGCSGLARCSPAGIAAFGQAAASSSPAAGHGSVGVEFEPAEQEVHGGW